MKPGATARPVASIVLPAVAPARCPIPAIRPLRTPMSPRNHGLPVPSAMRPPRIRRSKSCGQAGRASSRRQRPYRARIDGSAQDTTASALPLYYNGTVALEFFRRAAGEPHSLGVLPAAFNPPTRAHLALARAALGIVEEVLLVLPREFP